MEKPKFDIIQEGNELYITLDGLKIAKRGKGKRAGTWIALEPGYRIIDNGGDEIAIEISDADIH